MKNTVTVTMVVLLALACGGGDRPAATGQSSQAQPAATAAATPLTPEELGELGAKIRKTPDRADEILRERGLTAQTFETEIRKVTEDPAASKRYATAYRARS